MALTWNGEITEINAEHARHTAGKSRRARMRMLAARDRDRYLNA